MQKPHAPLDERALRSSPTLKISMTVRIPTDDKAERARLLDALTLLGRHATSHEVLTDEGDLLTL